MKNFNFDMTTLHLLVIVLIVISASMVVASETLHQHLHEFHGWTLLHCDQAKILSSAPSFTIPRIEIFLQHNQLTEEKRIELSSLSFHRTKLDFIRESIQPSKHDFDSLLFSTEMKHLIPYFERKSFDSLIFNNVPISIVVENLLVDSESLKQAGFELCVFSPLVQQEESTSGTVVFLRVIDDLISHESLLHPTLQGFPQYPRNAEETQSILKIGKNLNDKNNKIVMMTGLYLPSSLTFGKAKPHHAVQATSSSSTANNKNNNSAFVSPLPNGSPSWISFNQEWNAAQLRFRYSQASFGINCRTGNVAMSQASNFCNASDEPSIAARNETWIGNFPSFIRIFTSIVGGTSNNNIDCPVLEEQCLLAGQAAWNGVALVEGNVVCTVSFDYTTTDPDFFGDQTLRNFSASAAFPIHEWDPVSHSYKPTITSYYFSPPTVASPFFNGNSVLNKEQTAAIPQFFQEGAGFRPSDVSTMSQLPTFEPASHHENIKSFLAQGVIELGVRNGPADSTDGFHPQDVAIFFDLLPSGQKIPLFNYSDMKLVGNFNLTDAGETALDVEIMMSLSPGLNTAVWTLTGNDVAMQLSDAFKRIIEGTMNATDFGGIEPSVWSLSWGVSEIAYYGRAQVANYLDTYLEILAAAGVTFLASSGDLGSLAVGYTWVPSVSYPASLPHCISVGAASPTTQFGWTPTSSLANNAITTGGGFSRITNSVDFQQEYYKKVGVTTPGAIKSYGGQNHVNINPMLRNFSGTQRAVPDFSALGSQYLVVNHNTYSLMSGTSAATPLIASIVARINYEILRQNYTAAAPMPNVSQFLFEATALRQNCTNCWTDIIDGDNCASMGAAGVTSINFQTLYGPDFGCYGNSKFWDPVNGVGAPNFAAILVKALAWAKEYNDTVTKRHRDAMTTTLAPPGLTTTTPSSITTASPNSNNNNNTNNGISPGPDGSEGVAVIVASIVGVIVIGICMFAMYRSGRFGCGGDDATAANTQFTPNANYRNAAAAAEMQRPEGQETSFLSNPNADL